MDRWSKGGVPPGILTFRLLAERWTTRLLRELTDGPLQPSELEQRLPDAAHSALMRGLAQLALAQGVARKRIPGVPPRAYYELTEAGRRLFPIAEAAEDWERRWSTPARPGIRPGIAGRWTLRLLADEGNQTLLRALAKDPLRPIDVDGRVAHLSRSATRRRLSHLLANQLLSRTQAKGEVRYAQTTAAHLLGPIAALAAQWERQWPPRHAAITPPMTLAAPRAPALRATH